MLKYEKEVRFKNQGLDSIEVQDNGGGIAPQNYDSLALKHYTSKLSTYSDLDTLQTFGFRGEALSSLCALSRFSVVTCLQSDVPKGTRLEFETSGKLKGTGVVAAQKGTTVFVENLFHNLPVRRRELERNIKREWNKVMSLLNQYACIQTALKFTVSQQPNKGKRIVLFSTKGNPTTRENIVNVFGAKTIGALINLDLKFELETTTGQKWTAQADDSSKEIVVRGFVSRPAHGEGRQTPDRQMFFVNGRPCGLPQFAKVFNEVYRSYNASQSPFIFADIQLDTHLYDVNVSPDKRTILLHEQNRMLDNLKDSLTELFEAQDYTIPAAQLFSAKQTPYKKLSLNREGTAASGSSRESPIEIVRQKSSRDDSEDHHADSNPSEDEEEPTVRSKKGQAARRSVSAKSLSKNTGAVSLISRWVERKSASREASAMRAVRDAVETAELDQSDELNKAEPDKLDDSSEIGADEEDNERGEVEQEESDEHDAPKGKDQRYKDFHSRLAELANAPPSQPNIANNSDVRGAHGNEKPIPAIPSPTKPPEPRILSSPAIRPHKRPVQEVATITIGDHTVVSTLGSPVKKRTRTATSSSPSASQKQTPQKDAAPLPSFGGRLTQMFAASSTQLEHDDLPENGEEIIDRDDQDNDVPMPEAEESETMFLSEMNDSESDMEGEEAAPQHDESLSEDQESEPNNLSQSKLSDSGDDEYVSEEESDRKSTVVLETTETAEEGGVTPKEDIQKRSQLFLKGTGKRKDATAQLMQRFKVTERSLREQVNKWEEQSFLTASRVKHSSDTGGGLEADDAEEKLSLSIAKADFGKMKIVGQFNLGFVLAVRDRNSDGPTDTLARDDELFIIDQHASDEKYNFERLQASTVVQSQRLVKPKILELTAVEEEILIENQPALEANGFVVSVDESGDEPVGSRCQLLSLPLSRETTFSLADLEELISLLSEHTSSNASNIPRPSRVRKMFAMRACRSSIMIGKALSQKQMERVVRHMGEMEKPWNCPHGRPTMRHLCGLSTWDERGWMEGDDFEEPDIPTDWAAYVSDKTSEA